MRFKPNCKKCRKPYVYGQDGYCSKCHPDRPLGNEKNHPRCQCGIKAVCIIIQEVNPYQEELFEIEILLCQDCLNLELELEEQGHSNPSQLIANPNQIVVCKSLPRAKPKMNGYKL